MQSRTSFLTVLAAVAFLLPACALFNSDGSGQAASGDDRATLRSNREMWRSRGTEEYTLIYQINCFCTPESRGPFEVLVKDGSIVSVKYDGEVVDPEGRNFYTIDGLFGLLDEAIDRPADKIDVTYDKRLGYPTEFYIDYSFGMADEEMGATVLDVILHR